ncbi:MAG: T9SS C-terminal target domain-containing protein [Bacteroidetes bacterium]|nr:MAG: T9SS C-terminal target domain-containing protein [Bacteroidota bacterium]
MTRGAIVENAVVGVSLYDPENPQSSAGGILTVNDGEFRNNTIAVNFAPYQNFSWSSGIPIGNRSSFRNCRFVVDDEFPGDVSDFQEHVTMRRVTGIDFHGCTFRNNFENGNFTYADERRFGIVAIDSDFSVSALCADIGTPAPCLNFQNSEFSGFSMGILAFNTSTVNTFRVNRTDFSDNYVGIAASRIDNISVTRCTLRVGTALPGLYNPYQGLRIYNGTGFKVEENHFEVYDFFDPGKLRVGSVVIHSKFEPNEIYKNTYHNLDHGNLVNSVNRGGLGVGLEYLCNGNQDNVFDFSVPLGASIALNQGTQSSAAENVFTAMPTQNETHFQNQGPVINYFHSSGNAPTNFTISTVTPIAANQNSCISKLPGDDDGKLTDDERDDFINDYSNGSNQKEKIYAANMLIRDYVIDTTNQDLDSVRLWLSNKNQLIAHFAITDSWLQASDATAAQQVLNDIPNQFVLTGEELTEYNHFSTLKNIQINAVQTGKTDAQIVSENQTTLTQLAQAGNYYASVQAQNLLNSVNGFTYEPILVLPTGSQNIIAPPNEPVVETEIRDKPVLQAVPNPTQNETVFYFRNLPETTENAEIRISDLNGKVLSSIILTAEKSGMVRWNAEKLGEGVYIYSLFADGKILKTNRLVIVK